MVASVRFLLTNDDDGHWFLVPTHMEAQFVQWAVSGGELDQPEGVVPVNGHPSIVTFAAPELRGQTVPASLTPSPLERAMHSVWLHGHWRFLTSKMTTDEREAAADAVQRYGRILDAQSGGDVGTTDDADIRWWRS